MRLPRALLVCGIALRAATWALMTPQNLDYHLGVIVRMLDAGRLPISNETEQSYHPPLYYLITAPVFALTHRPKVVQLVSLACAVATLVVFYRLIVETPLFGRMRDRLLLFALAAVHPQLVTYGLYISNDTLAILLGALVAWQLWRWIDEPSPGRLRWLALSCGAGLLTKASFLAIVPAIAAAVVLVSRRVDPSAALRRSLEFVAIAVVVGSYKLVENLVYFGTPFVTNLESGAAWVAEQAAGRVLPWAYLGFDPRRLLLEPTGTVRQPYLELLYQTFWNEYLVMSNLVQAQRWPFTLVGSAVLVVAAVPTLAMAIGGATALASLPRRLVAAGAPSTSERVQIVLGVAVAALAAVLLLMIATEVRAHAWSIMHARLLLPAFAGALAALRVGWDLVKRTWTSGDRAIAGAVAATATLLLIQHLTALAMVPFRLAR